ncbi:hypothetical protein SDC9_60630 [bioreactor metagenome]|uniref:CBS domain-containing protein n=1 Tax=bioreactor metagenome TaxID=1076179 RepID=A0A644XER0_9ZZZZ
MPPPARYLSSHLDGAYFLNSACLLRKAHAHDEDRFIVNVGGQLFRSEYCLTEDAALADAVTLMLMSDNSKAFVVVEKNMQFLGLLTRRDIFALLKAQAPLNTVLRDICNKGPARLSSFSDEEYSHLSATTGHRIFPVVDSLGCAVGLKYSLDKDL